MIQWIRELFREPYLGVSLFLLILLCTFVFLWDRRSRECGELKKNG